MSVPSRGKEASKVVSYLFYIVDVLLDFRDIVIVGMGTVPHRLVCLNTWYPAGGAVFSCYKLFQHGALLADVESRGPSLQVTTWLQFQSELSTYWLTSRIWASHPNLLPQTEATIINAATMPSLSWNRVKICSSSSKFWCAGSLSRE